MNRAIKLCAATNANSKAWRAIRDLGATLAAAGEEADAKRYADVAAEFKRPILAAIEKSISRKTSPPFVPVALFGDEPVHDPILHSRIGSYWNIIIGYTMASGIFPPGSEEESWIAHYQEQHGGLCMGMLRAGGGQFNFWTSDHRINPLYGTVAGTVLCMVNVSSCGLDCIICLIRCVATGPSGRRCGCHELRFGKAARDTPPVEMRSDPREME
jgi:hypothetical protein